MPVQSLAVELYDKLVESQDNTNNPRNNIRYLKELTNTKKLFLVLERHQVFRGNIGTLEEIRIPGNLIRRIRKEVCNDYGDISGVK